MSIVKDPEHLPVFHHIAKNAGTYVLTWVQMLCRKYHLMHGDNQQQCWTANRIRRVLVQLEHGRQLTVIYYTPTDLTGSPDGILEFADCRKPDGSIDKTILLNAQNSYIDSILETDQQQWIQTISPQKFLDFVETKDIIPFCIIIDPIFWGGLKSPDNCSSWRDARIFIDKVVVLSEKKRALNFTVLRNPYDRALSIFNYIKSDNSSHEPNHDCLTSKSFEEYIQSDEVEDSWFLRSLMDMPDSAIIEPYHLTLAHEGYLKHFRISDISKVDDLINSVFNDSYGILQSDVEEWLLEDNIHKNATPYKLKIKLENLDPTIQQKFLDRTYWDRKLWQRYCK